MLINYALYAFESTNQYIIYIKRCSSMEQLFDYKTIKLQLPEKYNFGEISSISVSKDSNLLIADALHLRLILLFNKEGNFIKQIGNNGKGPGEYITPSHALFNSKGEIIVYDPSLFRISIYKSSGYFSYSFSVNKMIFGIATTSQDDILIHDQTATKIQPGNTIFAYNMQGELLYQCGETSNAYYQLRNIPWYHKGPFLAISGDCIFEMDYPDYHIRKYCQSGKLKKEFGIKPRIWKSLLATNHHKLPRPKMVDAETIAQLDKYFTEFYKSTYIDWIHTLLPGILVVKVHCSNTSDFAKDYYFMFYDTEGNLIKEGLKFNHFPKSSEYFYADLLPISPYGLCILQYENTPEEMQNVQLIILKPKSANEN